jgi:O-antigen/teichoic acid export membrane protein
MTSSTQPLAFDLLVLEDPVPPAEAAVLSRLHRPNALGADVRRGAKWMLGSRVGAQFLQFVGVLVTARLLIPADYGKMAVVYPIIGFSVIFTNLGLSSAVIHTRLLTERVLATAFWLNVLSGIVLTGVVSALSFPLAALFGEPLLIPLICLASIDFTLHAAVVHSALLERTLHFRAVAIIEMLGALASFIVIVIAAALGMGPFALVLGPIADTIVTVTCFWTVVRYWPRRWLDRESARELWGHAKGVTGFNVVNFWSRNADNLLLAGVVSQTALGNYNRAYNLMRLPVDQTVAMMSRVMFPALTRLRDDSKRLGQAWLKALSVAIVVTAPVTLLLAVSAPAAVHVLLGPRWLGMVPVLELLALAALPQVMCATAPGLLRATGDTGLLFRLGLLLSGITIAAMCIGLRWGTRGVATALLINFVMNVPVVLTVCCRKAHLHFGELYVAVRGVLLACAALLVVGYAVRDALEGWPPLSLLLAQTGACAVAYVGVLAIADRKALTTALSMVRRAGR